MKIEVDLTGIFNEETGEVVESVREAIIQEAVDHIYNKIDNRVDKALDGLLNKGIIERLHDHLDALIRVLMDYEFQQTNRYGDTEGERMTVKNKILKYLGDVCVFKDRGYSSDNNVFTNAMKAIIEGQMKLYKPEFDKIANAMFAQEAMAYAQKKLQEKLGIK
jgi:uncharacterized protein YqgV (UPF0045/DUF77 family)